MDSYDELASLCADTRLAHIAAGEKDRKDGDAKVNQPYSIGKPNVNIKQILGAAEQEADPDDADDGRQDDYGEKVHGVARLWASERIT